MPFITPGATPTETRCRRLLIPNNIGWLEVVNGALAILINERNWEQIDGVTPASAAETALKMFLDYQSSDCECEDVPVRLVGSIFPYATTTPPDGCLPCEGGTYNEADYPALYAALDTAFIVSPTQFALPDLRGRTVIGAGTGSGLSARAVGAAGGAETHQLAISEMPSHNHVINSTANSSGGTANAFVRAASHTGGSSVSANQGGGGAHNNMPPFVALKYAIVAIP